MEEIRRERPEDAEAVAGVHVRAWRAGYSGIVPAEVLDRLDSTVWARRRQQLGSADPGQPFVTLVAWEGGTAVGFTTYGPYRRNQDRDDLDPAYGEILAMYVEPDRWGSGIAQRLLSAALAGLTQQGWTEARLWVLADNARARRFYHRAGFTPDGGRSTYRLPRRAGQPPLGLPEVRYTCGLGPR